MKPQWREWSELWAAQVHFGSRCGAAPNGCGPECHRVLSWLAAKANGIARTMEARR